MSSARSLAIGALLPIAATFSCLSPQDIALDVPPTEVNLPPTFDPTKDVSPKAAEVCISSLDAPTEFRVDNIEDANDDPLQVRWFVDYDSGFTGLAWQDTLTKVPNEPVYRPATFSSANIDNFHRGSQSGPYLVEVVVSDGFDASPDAKPLNRAVAAGHYAATYRWTVRYVKGAPCE